LRHSAVPVVLAFCNDSTTVTLRPIDTRADSARNYWATGVETFYMARDRQLGDRGIRPFA
jgi:hypothetical protein